MLMLSNCRFLKESEWSSVWKASRKFIISFPPLFTDSVSGKQEKYHGHPHAHIFAGKQGFDKQHYIVEELFKGYFKHGKFISDR